MGRTNLMGFRPVDHIPETRSHSKRGLYDGLVTTVHCSGVLHGQDTKDVKRATNLAVTLRKTVKRLGYDDVRIVQRHTAVFIERRANGSDD